MAYNLISSEKLGLAVDSTLHSDGKHRFIISPQNISREQAQKLVNDLGSEPGILGGVFGSNYASVEIDKTGKPIIVIPDIDKIPQEKRVAFTQAVTALEPDLKRERFSIQQMEQVLGERDYRMTPDMRHLTHTLRELEGRTSITPNESLILSNAFDSVLKHTPNLEPEYARNLLENRDHYASGNHPVPSGKTRELLQAHFHLKEDRLKEFSAALDNPPAVIQQLVVAREESAHHFITQAVTEGMRKHMNNPESVVSDVGALMDKLAQLEGQKNITSNDSDSLEQLYGNLAKSAKNAGMDELAKLAENQASRQESNASLRIDPNEARNVAGHIYNAIDELKESRGELRQKLSEIRQAENTLDPEQAKIHIANARELAVLQAKEGKQALNPDQQIRFEQANAFLIQHMDKPEIKTAVQEIKDEIKNLKQASQPISKPQPGVQEPAPAQVNQPPKQQLNEFQTHVETLKEVLPKAVHNAASLNADEVVKIKAAAVYLEAHKDDPEVKQFNNTMKAELENGLSELRKRNEQESAPRQLNEIQLIIQELIKLISPQLAEQISVNPERQAEQLVVPEMPAANQNAAEFTRQQVNEARNEIEKTVAQELHGAVNSKLTKAEVDVAIAHDAQQFLRMADVNRDGRTTSHEMDAVLRDLSPKDHAQVMKNFREFEGGLEVSMAQELSPRVTQGQAKAKATTLAV